MKIKVKLPNTKIHMKLKHYEMMISVLEFFKENLFGFLSMALMIIIFLFSSQNAEQSSTTSNFIHDICINIFGIKQIIRIISIRKIAHFVLFALLGHCIFTHIRLLYTLQYKSLYYILSFMITFIYAIFDEVHQLFVFGRYGCFTDVLIDSFGCLVALLLNLIVITSLETKHNKTKNKCKEYI